MKHVRIEHERSTLRGTLAGDTVCAAALQPGDVLLTGTPAGWRALEVTR